MGLRILVAGEDEEEHRVRAVHDRLLGWGLVPDGPVSDRLGVGGWMARLREVCGQYRKDPDGLPATDRPEVCGLEPDHPDPGPGCGDWRPDPVTCPACGRSGAAHTRDYMRLDPACTAWPPAEA